MVLTENTLEPVQALLEWRVAASRKESQQGRLRAKQQKV
jgi:hypothetical protein